MNLIYEIDRNTTGMLLNEAAKKADGEIPFRAPAIALDQFSKNNRRYPTTIMEKALAKITDANGRTMWGSGGHREKFEVPDVTHRIDKLWIDNKTNFLMVEGAILPTTRGRDLAILVKAGKLGLSLKGTGSTIAVEEGKTEVTDDYKLLGIDFTLNPACSIAMVSKDNLFESVDFEEIPALDPHPWIPVDEKVVLTEQFFVLDKAITDAIKAKFGQAAYVLDYSDKEVVFQIEQPMEAGKNVKPPIPKLVQYKVVKDTVEISGDPTEVKRVIRYEEENDFTVKIREAVKTGLAKVDKKIRPLVETELKKQNIEAVELVEDAITEAENKVRFVINEAARNKIVEMVEDKPELGVIINYGDQSKDERRNKAIVNEARAAGSKLSVEEILAPVKK